MTDVLIIITCRSSGQKSSSDDLATVPLPLKTILMKFMKFVCKALSL
jgi:hypothetical protein